MWPEKKIGSTTFLVVFPCKKETHKIPSTQQPMANNTSNWKFIFKSVV